MGLDLVVGILADLNGQDEEGFQYLLEEFDQGHGPLKWQRYEVESYSCVCLLDACRKSLELKAAIVFN